MSIQMYASDHSAAIVTPHEKIAELFKQRDDSRRALAAAETNLAKLYAQREDAQAEMSEMVKQLSDAWEEIERLKTPAVLHAHCVRYMTEAQIAHLFGERMTKIVNELAVAQATLAEIERYSVGMASDQAGAALAAGKPFAHEH